MNMIFFGSKNHLFRLGSTQGIDAITPMCMFASVIVRDMFPTATRKFQQSNTSPKFEGHFTIDCAQSLHLTYPMCGAAITMTEIEKDANVHSMGKVMDNLPDLLVFVGPEFARNIDDLERRRLEARFRSTDRDLTPTLSHVEFMAAIRACHARQNDNHGKQATLNVVRPPYLLDIEAGDVGLREWPPFAVVVGDNNDRYVQRCMARRAISI